MRTKIQVKNNSQRIITKNMKTKRKPNANISIKQKIGGKIIISQTSPRPPFHQKRNRLTFHPYDLPLFFFPSFFIISRTLRTLPHPMLAPDQKYLGSFANSSSFWNVQLQKGRGTNLLTWQLWERRCIFFARIVIELWDDIIVYVGHCQIG